MLELSQLANLLARRGDPLWICSLPDRARTYLRCSTGAVYLSCEAARHILSGHTDIDMFELLLLPLAICRGELRVEWENTKFINAIYHEPTGKHYFVAMKRTANGHEVWVQTMYRLSPRKLRRKEARSFRI